MQPGSISNPLKAIQDVWHLVRIALILQKMFVLHFLPSSRESIFALNIKQLNSDNCIKCKARQVFEVWCVVCFVAYLIHRQLVPSTTNYDVP